MACSARSAAKDGRALQIMTTAARNTEQYIREIKLRRERIVSFDQYPFSLPAVKTLTTLPLHPAVTFFVGENGSGKSTLLEAIAVAWGFNPEGGTKNFKFQTRSSHSELIWTYNFLWTFGIGIPN